MADDRLPTARPALRTVSNVSAVEAARAVGPEIGRRSAAIEDNRTLPGDVVAMLAGAGLFKTFVPARYGGGEAHVLDGLGAIEEIGYHDGSAGWCVMIGATTGLLAGYLPPDHAATIYAPPEAITGGFAAPMGRATPVDGGLRVSGRWQWGSGSRHSTWIGGGCLVVDRSGKPAPRDDGLVAPFVLFERAQVELLDTWYVSGLRGTGSTDYEVADAFVPEGRWVQVGSTEATVDSPLYRFSFFGSLAIGIAAVTAGLARRSIDELVDLAGSKRPQGSNRALAERAPIQAEVARAEAAQRSSWAWLEQVVGEAWDDLAAGRPLTDEAAPHPATGRHQHHHRSGGDGRPHVHRRRGRLGLRGQPAPAALPRRARRHPARHGRPPHLRAHRPPAPRPPDRHPATLICPSSAGLAGTASPGNPRNRAAPAGASAATRQLDRPRRDGSARQPQHPRRSGLGPF